MPRNVDSRKLSQLLVGTWQSPRHGYVFRADGTYGLVGTDEKLKWRIDGNEYIDDVSRGPIILLDSNHFIYACGQGVIAYERANSTSSGNADKPSDLVGGGVSTRATEKQDFDAAKQEYEQSSHDEAARVTYVTKLAKVAGRLVSEYRRSGQRNDEVMGAINSELEKHPSPKNVDSKKLRQLLIGRWESPRRTYVYRANGKCGSEDGPISGDWRIQGNQLLQGDLSGPIILLNQDYFIYASRGSVFFHSRVKE
jgi:hypothetical protein